VRCIFIKSNIFPLLQNQLYGAPFVNIELLSILKSPNLESREEILSLECLEGPWTRLRFSGWILRRNLCLQLLSHRLAHRYQPKLLEIGIIPSDSKKGFAWTICLRIFCTFIVWIYLLVVIWLGRLQHMRRWLLGNVHSTSSGAKSAKMIQVLIIARLLFR